MTTCKRCGGMCIVGGGEWLDEKTVTNLKTGERKTLPAGFGFVSRECPDCKGTGETWTEAEIEEEYARECARIAEEEQRIRESGICPDCGAKSDEEGQRMCIPREIADTGDYSCAAISLKIPWAVDEGTGEVGDDSEREGDNTNKGDDDGDA